jgi:hypothetical protein
VCGVTGERIRQIFHKKGVWIRRPQRSSSA